MADETDTDVVVTDDTSGGPPSAGAGTGEPQGTPSAGASGPEGGEGAELTPSPEPTPSPTHPPANTPVDWRDKRIATLTARLRALQESNSQPQPTTDPAFPGLTQADVDRLAEQKAQQIAAQNIFNQQCNDAAAAGRRTFGESEFNSRINNLRKLVDTTDPAATQAYMALLGAAIETGEAAKLLHDLGGDLEEAQRILGLPPTRMAVELTKKTVGRGGEPSNVPKPPTPVGGRGASHERIAASDADRSDHLSTAEWMRRREAEVAERRRLN